MISKGAAPPRLWIVAGPNGSGKSTSYGRSDVSEFDGSVWIINPDLLTRRLQSNEDMDAAAANLEAVKRIETWLDASLDVHQTIGVETVLSTPKYRRLVRKAKERGFEIRFIYVYLDTVDRQLERIRLRVAKGGHDVPADKVAARRARSFNQFPWFFWRADQAWVFDNSGAEPKLVAWRDGESRVFLSGALLSELSDAIRDPGP
ncbi:MAG TPA: AAA family ATPase [Allosphingosinicella sp.]|nr:AAA family ATPase [Allosphingosinicella sp.]